MMKQLTKYFISILFLFLLSFIPSEELFSQMPLPSGNFKPKPDINVSQYKYKYLDIAYANESKAQKLDIYLPNDKEKFPLIIAIHAGAWESGDKRDGYISIILESLNRGYAVASINHRLSGEAKFPAQIYDIKAAIRFLRANADKYKLIPEKFALWGTSSGAHLAALAGTSGDIEELEDLNMGNKEQPSRVQAVITWFGSFVLDRTAMAKLFDPGVEETSDILKQAMPSTFISKDDPPFFLEHGNKDRAVHFIHSVCLAGAMEKVLGKEKVKFKIIEGADHGDQLFETEQNLNEMLDFLDKALSGDFAKTNTIASMDSSQTSISAPEAEKRGRALLDDVFKALGGRGALAAVKAIKYTLHINQGDMSINRIETVSYPDKTHRLTITPRGEVSMVVTKEDAWVKPPYQSVITLPEPEAKDARREILRDLINLAKNYDRLKVQYVERQIINSKTLEDILILLDEDSFHIFIDPATDLPSRIIYTDMGRPCGPMDITRDLSEYKTIAGIQLGTKFVHMIAGQTTLEASITDIQLNPTVDLKIFERP